MTIVSKEAKVANLKAFEALDGILGKKAEPVAPKPLSDSYGSMPDVSKIQLNENVMSQLFETKKKEVKPQVQSKPKIVEETKDIKLAKLVTQLASLLQEAKQLMSEMTTTGMIATNQKFTFGEKKPKTKVDRFKALLKGKK